MENLENKNEEELREIEVETPKTMEELAEIIKQLTNRKHDYGTCVYAMSIAATAAFNYVASVLGCTGFQASCADLDILKRTRGYKNGFKIIDYNNLLYPQYYNGDYFKTKEQLLEENKEQLLKSANLLLESRTEAHKDVIAHWKMIVEKFGNIEDK